MTTIPVEINVTYQYFGDVRTHYFQCFVKDRTAPFMFIREEDVVYQWKGELDEEQLKELPIMVRDGFSALEKFMGGVEV